MSVRCGIFYAEAQGTHWHAWHNPMRSREGVFVEVNREFGADDEWGYQDLEVETWLTGADIRLHIQR